MIVLSYIIIGVVSLIMLGSAVCMVFRIGEKDGICKYGHDDE